MKTTTEYNYETNTNELVKIEQIMNKNEKLTSNREGHALCAQLR